MKYVTYISQEGQERVGVLSPDGSLVYSLRKWWSSSPTLADLIADYTPELHRIIQKKLDAKGVGIPLETVILAAPIPHPRHDILCIGLNYAAHAEESAAYKGMPYIPPVRPTFFSKRVNRAVAHEEPIPAHADITSRLDYEVELAVVIGKRCDHVKPEEVLDHIFGYTIVNDVSARDIQHDYGQWTFGKSLDGFAPMGPWIVTADEIPDPGNLRVTTRVNGEIRQDSRTSDFIFDIPRLVSELSAGITLEPGDILITGTPSGVAMGMDPPRFLNAGDVVECEIEGIGILRNTIG